MSDIFPKWTNKLPAMVIAGGLLVLAGAGQPVINGLAGPGRIEIVIKGRAHPLDLFRRAADDHWRPPITDATAADKSAATGKPVKLA